MKLMVGKTFFKMRLCATNNPYKISFIINVNEIEQYELQYETIYK